MADLYVSLLGAPFRALAVSNLGPMAFVRIGEQPDEFALDPTVWIDTETVAVGQQARTLERSGAAGDLHWVKLPATVEPEAGGWSRRDLVAMVLRRFIVAAEQQSGETVGRVIGLVRADAPATLRADFGQAAILAGAQKAEIIDAGALMLRAARSATPGPGGKACLIEAWNDGLRITLGELKGHDRVTVIERPDWSREQVRERISTQLDPMRRGASLSPRAFQAVTDRLFNAWINEDIQDRPTMVVEPSGRGAPVVVHAPPTLFAQAQADLDKSLFDLFTECGIDLADLGSVVMMGAWMAPVGRSIRTLAPQAAVIMQPRLAFEAALTLSPPGARVGQARLGMPLSAIPVRVGAARAIHTGDPVQLLAPGLRLPASYVSESFDSSAFLEQFAVAMEGDDGRSRVLTVLPIPRFAENQGHSYLKVVVHNETEDLILIETAYLYSTDRRFWFYDKRADCRIEVAGDAFRQIREFG